MQQMSLVAKFMCGLASDLVIYKSKKESGVTHDAKSPYSKLTSLKNNNSKYTSMFVLESIEIQLSMSAIARALSEIQQITLRSQF